MFTCWIRRSLESGCDICFVGNVVGENRSHREGMLLKLAAADHGRVLNDGTGLSGKVHAGAKGVSVHFRYRYRFQGGSREMALGAWPRVALDVIRANFEETKLRVERGGDPAGQKQAVAKKIQIEQAQLEQQQQELAEQQRGQAEQQLTVHAMFEDWHVASQVDNTPASAKAVRRLFELHLLPEAGKLRVLDVKPEHVRKAVKALIDAGKVSTAIATYIYINAMFIWAGRRKPWRLLFEINPAEEVDLDRMLPAGYQSWCERALADDEIIELRNRFETVQNTWELHAGPRRGRIAKPIPREHVLGCWIMLATLVRINELCAARWKEHINFKAATWYIPSDQAKNRKATVEE